jgi:hypothetical protein
MPAEFEVGHGEGNVGMIVPGAKLWGDRTHVVANNVPKELLWQTYYQMAYYNSRYENIQLRLQLRQAASTA